MLCNSLGSVEGLLRLPPDARVISQGEQQKGENSDGTVCLLEEEEEVDKPVMALPDDRLLIDLSHEQLRNNMKEQAVNLREKITKVNQLLT